MKQLQNNYTTPEQSKRLLELGLPADSADLGIVEDIMHGDTEILRVPYSQWCKGYENISTPCWSVGRLIEIVDMCSVKQDYVGKFEFEINKSYIQTMVYLIIGLLHDKELDFSKLEE